MPPSVTQWADGANPRRSRWRPKPLDSTGGDLLRALGTLLVLTPPGVIATLPPLQDPGELGGIINHSLHRPLLFAVPEFLSMLPFLLLFLMEPNLMFMDC